MKMRNCSAKLYHLWDSSTFRCHSFTLCTREGSGISDVLVAAGVIADGSVDRALGKHFKRGVCCLRLFYETLVHHAPDKRLEGFTLADEKGLS